MWVDREIIPLLIDAVGIKIKEELKIQEDDEANQSEDFDPNDLVIYQSFVLPVLLEKKEKSFDSEEMLHKGFSFMISLIPGYLKEYRKTIDKNQYGKLSKLYYNHRLNEAIIYLNSIEEKYIEENTGNINSYIDLSKIN
jgi:hypothetical protein